MKEWISLNMTPGIGPRAATKLLEKFGSAENVFHATRSELESLRLKAETIESIIKREFHEKAEEEFEQSQKAGRRCFDSRRWQLSVFFCAKSPTRRLLFMLKEIGRRVSTRRASRSSVRGAARLTAKTLRRCLRGIWRKKEFALFPVWRAELIRRRIAARFEAKGKTIAVLGTGIDNVYPKENAKLVE